MSKGYTGPPQSSGGGGGTVVVILLIIGAVLGLGCLGICGLGFLGFAWTAQNPELIVEQAVGSDAEASVGEFNRMILEAKASALLAHEERVKDALGAPITVDKGAPHQVRGSIHTFDLQLSGPQSTATAHVEGRENGTDVEIDTLQIRFSDGSTIDVDPHSTN